MTSLGVLQKMVRLHNLQQGSYTFPNKKSREKKGRKKGILETENLVSWLAWPLSWSRQQLREGQSAFQFLCGGSRGKTLEEEEEEKHLPKGRTPHNFSKRWGGSCPN